MRLIKRPIKKKIMQGFGVIITLMVISNAFVLFQLDQISTSAKTTLVNNVTRIDVIKRLQAILLDEERSTQKFFISRDRAYYDLFIDGVREFEFHMDSLILIRHESEQTELIHQIRQSHSWFVNIVDKESRKIFSTDSETPDNFSEVISDSLSTIFTKLNDIILRNQHAINTSLITVEAKTANSLLLALLLTLGTLALATVLSIFIARTITHPVEQLIEGTEKIASGSFCQIQVKSKDEIAYLSKAINDMSEKLRLINEYKADMMQQISHEIRSPLQMIMWVYHYLTSQEPGPLNDEQLKMLESIRSTVDRVANFSNQFLELAKSEAGMTQYKLERADIVELVKTVVNDLQFGAVSKNIAIELNTVSSAEVTIDTDKIYLVIANLMSNALKYTHKNGKVQVQVKPIGKSIRLTISDNGMGIAPDDLPHIFTKFYRAGNVSKYGGAGTGVGLALVKALVEGHGGKVSAESTLNVGSAFTVELPFSGENIQQSSAALNIIEENKL